MIVRRNMRESIRKNSLIEKRSIARLKEGDIFEDDEQYYKVLKIKEIRGRAYYAQVKCIDRNDEVHTISYDYSDYDRVRIYYEEDFTWVFSFIIVDKSDTYSKRQMIIHTFSKSEALDIFRIRCKREYPKHFIREIRIEMNQVH